LDKALVSQLASGDYIERGETLLITGNTGSGKSFLASALGHHACSQGHRVAYHNMQKLSIKIKMARSDGSIIGFLEKLAKTHLLVIDDFGLARLDPQLSLDFMDIMEDRYGKNATIISSQIPVASWYDLFPEETVADAIMDRLAHGSYRMDLLGESLRKKR
jgi:DNA replication protein DnaC